jgi:large subunit ribosomal protein L33
MAKGKVKSIFVKLLSGAGTGFFYVTRKNPKNVPERLTLRKYDPVVVSRPAHRRRSAPAPPQPRAPATLRPRPPPAFKPSRPPDSAPPRPRLAQT